MSKGKSFFIKGLLTTALVPLALFGEVFKPAKVTASSFSVFNVKREVHNPELTADGKIGNPYSYWGSDVRHNTRPPHWLLFDFGKEIKCNTITLELVPCTFKDRLAMAINRFRLEYDVNGTYKTFVECKGLVTEFRKAMQSKDPEVLYTTAVPSLTQVYRFEPITTSKIRLVVDDDIARLDEMTVEMRTGEQTVAKTAKTSPAFKEDGVLRYSFGPKDAELAPGFVRGEFASASEIYNVDRNDDDSVRRYFAYGAGDAQFRIPVKPGNYRVMAIGGDFYAPTPGAHLKINGTPLDIPANFERVFFWDERTVEAQDSILVETKGPWLLNAILVAPISAAEAYDKALNQAIIGPDYPRFKEDPQVTNTNPPSVSKEELAKGYLFYAPSLQQRIFPKTTPLDSQKAKTVAAAGAKDTVKAISIAAYGLKHIPDFDAKVTPLVCKGATLNATIYPIRCWPQRTGHKGSGKNYDKVPELLDDSRPMFLEQGQSRQYYILVDVPKDAPAGAYKGSIELTGKGIAKASIPLTFTVYPFVLPRLDNKQYAAMYFSDKHRGPIANHLPRFTKEEQLTMDVERLADMRRHNMNSIVFPEVSYLGKEKFEAHYREVNELMDKAGYPRFPMPYHYKKLNEKITAEIVEVVQRTGLREILFYPVDEPYFNKQEEAMVLFPMAKKVPGARTYSTITQDDIRKFGQYLDFRAYMVGNVAEFEPERIREECKKDGAHFWWYTNSAREYPDCTRYKAGFFQFKCQATGQLYWAYDDSRLDPFCDFDHGSSDNDHLSVIYVGKKLHSTIQWEGIREGLDDLRYAYYLEDLIAKAPKSAKAKAAKAVLEKVRKETVTDLNVFKKTFGADIDIHQKCLWAPEKFDQLRQNIIDAILSFD